MSRISVEKRSHCIKLYMEGLGFRAIERLEDVSHVTAMKWVRKLGEKIAGQIQENPGKSAVMGLDELWYFIGKKNKSAGSGLRMIVMEDVSVPSGLVVVEQKRAFSSTAK